MSVKYTKSFLTKLESIFAESDYVLRYEKGNFKAGFCLLKDQKIIIVNKYFTTEGKITCLVDLIKTVQLDPTNFTEKSQEIFSQIQQTKLSL